MSKLKTFAIPPRGKQKRKPDPYYPAAVATPRRLHDGCGKPESWTPKVTGFARTCPRTCGKDRIVTLAADAIENDRRTIGLP